MSRWAEECLNIYNFHQEKIRFFGEAKQGKGSKGKWSLQDTADHYMIGKSTVSENLKIAESLLNNQITQDLTRDQALEIAISKQIKFWCFAVKIKDRNELYKRADTGLPFMFSTLKHANDFTDAFNRNNHAHDTDIEPVRLEFRVVEYKDKDKDND